MTKSEYIALAPIRQKKSKIDALKASVKATNDKIIEYVEGVLSDEEFAKIKALRQSYRDEISKLEAEIAELEQGQGVSSDV